MKGQTAAKSNWSPQASATPRFWSAWNSASASAQPSPPLVQHRAARVSGLSKQIALFDYRLPHAAQVKGTVAALVSAHVQSFQMFDQRTTASIPGGRRMRQDRLESEMCELICRRLELRRVKQFGAGTRGVK